MFNVFSYIILQFKLKTVQKISEPYCMIFERPKFVPRKLGMKLLEMVKDMEINHSVSSALKVWEDVFFLKKLFMQTFLGKFMGGGLFYMGSNDQIMQGGRKSFTNAFSSNLNSVNLKVFPGHGGRHT